jgi:hypothetical protein
VHFIKERWNLLNLIKYHPARIGQGKNLLAQETRGAEEADEHVVVEEVIDFGRW